MPFMLIHLLNKCLLFPAYILAHTLKTYNEQTHSHMVQGCAHGRPCVSRQGAYHPLQQQDCVSVLFWRLCVLQWGQE